MKDVVKVSDYKLPVVIRDGAPVCLECDIPMVQVDGPSGAAPGGIWQCPAAKDELELARADMNVALRRMADELTETEGT